LITLGIESSCDETSCGILEDSGRVLSNIILSQKVHSDFGGVVPEIASREHNKYIYNILNESLLKANINLSDVDLIGVTNGPGLIGALMVGIAFAKGLSYSNNIPICAVNHLEGHILVNFISENVELPALVMLVSGGHTELVYMKKIGHYKVLAKTIDDAAGELFDKVARILGLGYPGGPEIEKISITGDEYYLKLPIAVKGRMDFSFSGLKTSILYHYRNLSKEEKERRKADIAASLQKSVADNLIDKIGITVQKYNPLSLVLSGGVAANKYLRERLNTFSLENKIGFYVPPIELCTDNGIMIAKTAYENYILNNKHHSIIPVPNLKLLEV
jgi:N6-L-threonylcarbamoyladenine synthase